MKIYNIINIPKGLSPEFECDCREEYNSGYTEGLEEGFDKGYDSGYTDGAESVDCEDFYDSGYTDGYESGYTSGYTDGQESVDCTDFYNSGVTDGYASGYTSGRTDGYDDGWQPGYDSGRTDGEEAGYEEGKEYQKTLLVFTAITANGTYEREDGFNQVVVNVPSMSGAGYTSGYTDGYSSGYTDGSENGFDSGYTSGVTDGYARGYTSGKTDAWQPAYDSGYTDGVASVDCQPLYDSGYTDGYSSGRTDGYDDGWRPGYDSGYTDGLDAAGGDYASGYTDGFDAGYGSGVTDGYASGYTSGKTEGFGEGYDSGYTDGAASVDCQPLYDSGYTDGYESGHTDGYVERAAMLTAMTITANGAYESVEGWSAVTVNVPQTGRTESKEVYLSRADFPIIPPQAGIPEGEIWIGTRKYYSPSSGYIGMDTFFLDAELNVTDIYVSGHTSGVTDGAAQQKALLSATAFTTNGTYTRTDGWSAVTVNVPQTGYTQQDLDNAYTSGLTNGYNSGWTAGYNSGYTDGYNNCGGMEDYITFEILSAGSITWEKTSANFSAKTIDYRINGDNWSSITSDISSSAPSISVQAGDIVEFKGDNDTYGNSTGSSHFGGSVPFNIRGNIMSLINSTDFHNLKELPASSTNNFRALFTNGLAVDASGLLLPATALTSDCYEAMFADCIYLTAAPELPATSLAQSCYDRMFSGCRSLTGAPSTLPATSITNTCYYGMFQGCRSLTSAPELPATALNVMSYQNMFRDCTNLNYIKCLATDISFNACTSYWVQNVQTTSGTFVKAASMTSWTTGANGIPQGWTVVDA